MFLIQKTLINSGTEAAIQSEYYLFTSKFSFTGHFDNYPTGTSTNQTGNNNNAITITPAIIHPACYPCYPLARWPLPWAEARHEPRKFCRRPTRRTLKVTREVPDSKLLPVPDWGSQAGCVAVTTSGSFGQLTRNPTPQRQRVPRKSMQRKAGVKFVGCDGYFRKIWGMEGSQNWRTASSQHTSTRHSAYWQPMENRRSASETMQTLNVKVNRRQCEALAR